MNKSILHRNACVQRIEDMGNNYQRLFQVIPQETVPDYLCERIVGAVLRERERYERSRLVISSLFGASSLVGLVFALPALMAAAATSWFSTFASLLISDNDLIVSHFNSFALSLLEALPGFEVTITLLLLAVFLVSFQNFVLGLSDITAHARRNRAAFL